MLNTKKMNEDYYFGEEQERIQHELLNSLHETQLEKTKRYAIFDYKSKGLFIELKTRRSSIKLYPTTMLPYNKIKKAEKYLAEGNEVWFYFKYPEGLYRWKYSPADYTDKDIRKGGRFDRGTAEISQYLYIGVDKLKSIEDLE